MSVSRGPVLRLFCHVCEGMRPMRVVAARGLREGALRVKAACPDCGGRDDYVVGERAWREAERQAREEVSEHLERLGGRWW